MSPTADDLVFEQDKKVRELLENNPDLAGDVELEDIHDVENRIDFIVPQTDDPSTPACTIRSVFIGTIFCVALSFANSLFQFRTSPFSISASIAVILAYPIGIFFAATLPRGILNPGPFSIKEHALVYIIAQSSSQPYGLDNVVSQTYDGLMGNAGITFAQSLAFVMVTQFLGYGLSGLTRRYLVKPTAMWWPGNLSIIALFSSFHKVETGEVVGSSYKLSRFVVFWIAFTAIAIYTWIPEYFMPALQSVSVLCLFAGYGVNSNSGVPNKSGILTTFNAIAASTNSGVGVFGLTFDWSYIGSSYITSPFWASAVYVVGNIFFSWILVPILYAKDVWGNNALLSTDGENPTVNTPRLFNGNASSATYPLGHPVSPAFFYNASDGYNINMTAYNDVAPLHITSYFALTYGTSFMTITAALSHVFLWYGADIYRQTMNAFRQLKDEVDALDKHVKMMEAYPEVPDWAYLIFLGVTMVGAVAVSVFTEFGMPWWTIFFNIFLCSLFILPFGIIQAISGFGLGLNVLTEFIIGLMLPGQTVAVMAFKSWGTNNLIQSLSLSQDLKLGQYLHIPPYAMVFAQFWGTFVNAIVATAAAYWAMFNSGDLLTKDDWQYTNYHIFYSAGGIWGAIGPQRFFGIGSLYEGLLWCFAAGLLSPFLPWLANKYIVQSKYWHWVNFPLIYSMWGPGGYQNNYVMPLIVAYYCQVYLFKNRKEFYQKYLYVIGAALDGGNALSVTIIAFFAVFNINFQKWNILNPNYNIVPYDYYCYPGADYNDYDCSYYLARGENTTATGTFCLLPDA